MTFSFAQLIAHATKTRALGAGTIVGSGTVSNYDRSRGAQLPGREAHAREIESGARAHAVPAVRRPRAIEMLDADGRSIFGAIDQRVESYRG